jgi:hypothetical protein
MPNAPNVEKLAAKTLLLLKILKSSYQKRPAKLKS